MGPIQSDYLDDYLRRNPYATPPFMAPGTATMGGDPGDVPPPDSQTSNVPLNYFGQTPMMGGQQQAAPMSAPNFGGEPPDVTSPEQEASDYASTPAPATTGSASRPAPDTDEGETSSDEAQQPSTVNPAATGGAPATPPPASSQTANMAAQFPMSEQYKQALAQYANRQPSKLQQVLGAIVGSAFPRVGQLITNPRMAMDQQKIQALSQAASTEQGEARTAALMAEDKARVDMIKAQTQYFGTGSIATILNHGGAVIPPGGQPPPGKTGSIANIAGQQVWMPDMAERAKEQREAQQSTWPTITPEMANSPLGKQFGLQPGQKLNPTDWAKFMDAAARGRGLIDVPEDLQDALGGAKQATTDQILAAIRGNKAKAIQLGPDVNAALLSIGADPNNPKPQEVQQALKIVEKHKLAERPVTNNNIIMPQTPEQKAAAATPIPQGQTTNDAFLQTLPPEEQAVLKAWAQGMRKIPQGSALRDANIKKWYSDLSIYDPKASEQRFQVRTEFTAPNSKTAGNVRSLNTLTGHLGTLNDMAEALQNNNLVLYNQLANKLVTAFGDPRLTNFELAKAAVSTELSSALKGQATEGDIKTWAQQIQGSASPQQIQGYAKTPLMLMKSRLQALNQQWVNAFGQNAPDGLIVYPEAAQTFQKFGVNPGSGGGGGGGHIIVKAPNGKSYPFKTQQEADKFKKDAGIQ